MIFVVCDLVKLVDVFVPQVTNLKNNNIIKHIRSITKRKAKLTNEEIPIMLVLIDIFLLASHSSSDGGCHEKLYADPVRMLEDSRRSQKLQESPTSG